MRTERQAGRAKERPRLEVPVTRAPFPPAAQGGVQAATAGAHTPAEQFPEAHWNPMMQDAPLPRKAVQTGCVWVTSQ